MLRKLLPLLLVILLGAAYLVFSDGVRPGVIGYAPLLHLRQRAEMPSHVVLVAIDGPSLDSLGNWPWNQRRLRELLKALAQWKPRTVVVSPAVFDAVSDHELWKILQKDSVSLVLPMSSNTDKQCGTPRADGESYPLANVGAIPGLCDEHVIWGVDSLWLQPSPKVPLFFRDRNGNILPGLAAAALPSGSGDSSGEALPVKGEVSPDGSVLIDLSHPLQARVSAKELLSGQVVGDLFRDRTVVLGVTASGVEPMFDASLAGAPAGRSISRSEFLAMELDGLWAGQQRSVAPWGRAYAVMLLAAACFLCGMSFFRAHRLLGFSLCGGLCILAGGVFGVSFFFLHSWVDPLPAVLFPALAALALALPVPVKEEEEPEAVPSGVHLPGTPPRTRSGSSVTTVKEATEVIEVARREVDRIERSRDGEYLKIGRFEQLSPLGRGSMGSIFQAYDPKMDRKVAIKILRPEKSHEGVNEARFLREAKVAGSLHHPNINTLFEYGRAEDLWYLVLEYIEGQTLAQWIKENPGASPRAILPWLQQIASALDTAHGRQIIHRDVKPSNLMIQNGSGLIKLMDFGVAHTPDATLTQAGTTVGTPNYMSPELLQGSRVTETTDLYALGVVTYQMLTQRVPFHGDGLTALCNNILRGNSTPLASLRPDLPAGLCAVVHKAFAVRAENRYLSGAQFVEAYERSLEE